MKFERNLPRHQIPEWAPFYLNYRRLKSLLKPITHVSRRPPTSYDGGLDDGVPTSSSGPVDSTSEPLSTEDHMRKFLDDFGRERHRVHSFYSGQWAACGRKLASFNRQHGIDGADLESIEWSELMRLELHDMLEAAVELREELKKLLWFAHVNREASDRISSKLGQYCLDRSLQNPWSTTPHSVSFEHPTEAALSLASLHALLAVIRQAVAHAPEPASPGFSLFLRAFLRLEPSAAAVPEQSLLSTEATAPADPSQGSIDRSTWSLALRQAHVRLQLQQASADQVERLLTQVDSLQLEAFKDEGSILHHFVVLVGRADRGYSRRRRDPWFSSFPETDDARPRLHAVLSSVIRHLKPGQRDALWQKDGFGRLPLHYAAHYGLVDAVREILQAMKLWSFLDDSMSIAAVELQDEERCSPLHLAVIAGQADVTGLLLAFGQTRKALKAAADQGSASDALGALLAVALRSGFDEIVSLLLDTLPSSSFRGRDGLAALHVAVLSGREDYVKLVLDRAASGAIIDIAESVYGWTPLFFACARGSETMVQVLLEAGASCAIHDSLGWTASDHAAFRGHIPIPLKMASSRTGSSRRAVEAESSRAIPARSGTASDALPKQDSKTALAYIIINIGTLDLTKARPAVDLGPYRARRPQSQFSATDISIKGCLAGGETSRGPLQIPLLDESINDPWIFPTIDPAEAKIVFEISSDGKMLGRAVALLASIRQGLGPSRDSLIREATVPILEVGSVEYLGTVTFSFLVVTPFSHERSRTIPGHSTWAQRPSTMVGGHRGLGQNTKKHAHLEIGENTVQSFLTARDLHASFVEFDAQLTKDQVPIIYHDFFVSETGTDAPVHTLKLDQFMHVSDAQSAETTMARRKAHRDPLTGRLRSRSVDGHDDGRAAELMERMRYTAAYRYRGFICNTRGAYIHEPFIKLQDLLRRIPESFPFNMEIKYPMLSESFVVGMDSYATEINTFVDKMLQTVYDHSGDRAMVFSSFSPEVCILLSMKQSDYPVFFLNQGNGTDVGDGRAGGVQQAVHFARRWRLAGIVMESEPLVVSPRLVGYVRGTGLACFSYGRLNNDPASVKIQAEAGVDAVIVDEVRLISESLGLAGRGS